MSKPIDGPYKYGNGPPLRLMGWRPEAVPAETIRCAHIHAPYTPPDTQPANPPTAIWILTKKITNGRHLPTFEQETGDCVAAAVAQAGARLQVAEIITDYQEEELHPWYVPYVYGISRVQVGKNQINGPGSTGTWGAAAVRQYGVLFADDPNVPPYTAAASDTWGDPPGPPADFLRHASDNPVRTTARLRNIQDVRNALCNYNPITIASFQGFRMQPENRDGYHVWIPHGSWAHQMSLIAWMDKPFQAAYRLNSWGPDAHGTPLRDEPPGGAWCPADVLEAELRDRNTEVYTYSSFHGFPSAADRGLLSKYS